MGKPYLTAIIVNDGEKDPKLLEYCFQAIRTLNADAIADMQFIVLNQDLDGSAAHALANAQPFAVEWFDAGYECVGGVVLWDIMGSMKRMMPSIRGRYHIIMHKEWVCGPDVLCKSMAWLKANGEPPVAIANLRRVGTKAQLTQNHMASSGKQTSERIRRTMDAGDKDAICKSLKRIKTLPWKYWQGKDKREPGQWVEDAFFARTDWLESMRFYGHADRQLFQDVYDLMAILFRQLAEKDMAPPCPQIPLKAGKLYHLWHTKGYVHFSDRVIDFFCSDGGRWGGTQFVERNTMERLRDFVSDGEAVNRNPLISFRQDANGTARRFAEGLERWLRGRGRDDDIEVANAPTPVKELNRVVLMCRNRRWSNRNEPQRHVAAGLKNAGYQPLVVNKVSPSQAWPPWSGGSPDAVFVWNGINGGWGERVDELRKKGTLVAVMERGFFDRMNYTQLDYRGFGFHSSWAKHLRSAAPVGSPKRFRDIFGAKPIPMKARSEGYILVLLQMHNDSQLAGAEIKTPGELVASVVNGVERIQSDVEIRVRAHPNATFDCGEGRAQMMNGELKDAVAGARFCVTINSNAGNEALAWGCPVLAYGPALYLKAGVASKTSVSAIRVQIQKMMDGWAPTAPEVRNYLYHLASRQWSREELAQGDVLSGMIAEAMGA